MQCALRNLIVAVGGSVLVVSGAGCAPKKGPPAAARPVGAAPAQAADVRAQSPAVVQLDPKARLGLDEIEPDPATAPPAPPSAAATQPVRPPIDALVLYAQARAALDDNQPFTAVGLLERAIGLDPGSPHLRRTLGEAYLGSAAFEPRSIRAYEAAAELAPGHFDTLLSLGRQYLAKGDLPTAIRRLRAAMATRDYATDDDAAATVDYFLARALRQGGYDRAALERYEALLRRLQTRSLSLRRSPELGALVNRPEVVLGEVGQLHERAGRYREAMDAYRPAAEREPHNFDLQARLVRLMDKAGAGGDADAGDAAAAAAELVARFRASRESLALLQEVAASRPGGAVGHLSRLHEQRPDDRAITFALADALGSTGQTDRARSLLEAEWHRSAADPQVTGRLFDLLLAGGGEQVAQRAADLLVRSLARQPESARELTPLWTDLMRPGRKDRLRLPDVQALAVPPWAEGARAYWVARTAELWRRDALARSALQEAARHDPPLPPAYRALVDVLWATPDWSPEQKAAAVEDLATTAATAGNPALAAEVRGLSLLEQDKPTDAAAAFDEAARLGGRSPELLLERALAARAAGDEPRFEQTLWKLVSDYPAYEDAYAALFNYYLRRPGGAAVNRAMTVLGNWLRNDPASVEARLLQATLQAQVGQAEQAQRNLLKLFDEHPDDAQVIGALLSFHRGRGQVQQLIDLLEQRRAQQPDERALVEYLVEIYDAQGRRPDAVRVLDEARAAVGDDPDLLYYVASLYHRVGQQELSEQLLQEVVRLDPAHPSASNDLGYFWADAGRNLDRAEQLIRVAVAAEPDNQSFLDSLGWVLYKRGKFAESKEWFERAIGPAALPDPVILDHLGDVYYRLNDTDAARRQWDRTLRRLDEERADREDLKELRLKVRQKLKQLDGAKPVDVAPIVEHVGGPTPDHARR